MYKYGELTFSYSFFSVWTHKLRFLAKLLHIPKRAKNAIFYRKFRVFPVFPVFSVFFSFFVFSVFSVCFETVCFGFFASIPKQTVSIELKQTGDPPKQFKREYIFIFLNIQGCFGLFRFVTKQFCLFRLFRYRFETPKQTEIFSFWFHETNRNKRETDLVSVCFGSNRNKFLFVSRTPQVQLVEQTKITMKQYNWFKLSDTISRCKNRNLKSKNKLVQYRYPRIGT